MTCADDTDMTLTLICMVDGVWQSVIIMKVVWIFAFFSVFIYDGIMSYIAVPGMCVCRVLDVFFL